MKYFIACGVPALVLLSAISGCTSEKAPAKPAPVVVASPPSENPAPTVPREKLANKLDPICDMDLEEQVQFTTKHDGKEYGFCSIYCVREFEKDPKKFIAKLAEPGKSAPATMPATAK